MDTDPQFAPTFSSKWDDALMWRYKFSLELVYEDRLTELLPEATVWPDEFVTYTLVLPFPHIVKDTLTDFSPFGRGLV